MSNSASAPVIGVVTNPNSQKNRANPQRYEQMRAVVGDLGLVRRTQDVTAIADVVREFLAAGVRYFVADGGDGAFHWLMNTTWQVLDKDSTANWPAILPTNAGTVDFVGRKAEVIGGCDQLLPELVRLIDSGGAPKIVRLPTFDLRTRFGMDPREPGQESSNLVVKTTEGPVSLVVDDIGDVIEIDASAGRDVPETVDASQRQFVRQIVALEGRLMLRLDLGRLFEDDGKSGPDDGRGGER